MDQSKSNNEEKNIPVPKRSMTVELAVGVFTLIAVAAAGYLAVGLGDIELGTSDKYIVYAEFDNISGLKDGASVEIAGVQIGEVVGISLSKDLLAMVTLRINKNQRLRSDDIAAIRTKGIIGDRFVKISPGASDDYLQPGDVMIETESVVDFEDIVGKIVHSMTSDGEDV